MARRNIVVIGASAGGITPLQALISRLGPDFPASLFAVIHGSTASRPHLPDTIAARSSLPVRFASHGDRIQNGVLLLAPPDRHLLIKEDRVMLTRGARENLWRPSVDVLFRSAAVAHASRVVGVILSGGLDDGTAGAAAICACGGAVLVQEPEESEVPDMPASVIRSLDGIRVVKSAELPDALRASVQNDAPQHEVPEKFRIEARFAERTRRDIESSLWSAVRLFQQRANLDRKLAQQESQKGRIRGADQYAMRAAEAESNASVLHDLLMQLPESRVAS